MILENLAMKNLAINLAIYWLFSGYFFENLAISVHFDGFTYFYLFLADFSLKSPNIKANFDDFYCF